MVGRIPVIDVKPVLVTAPTQGALPVKAAVGEPFPVSATVFREGHDRLGAEVVLVGPDGRRRPPVRMTTRPAVDRHTVDRYEAWVSADTEGPWTFEVQAWSDPVATWEHATGIKVRAGIDVELMFAEGVLLLERVLAEPGLKGAKNAQKVLKAAVKAAKDTKRPAEARLAQLESPELRAVLASYPLRDLLTVEGPFPVYVDRPRALFGSWYEFFPRSEGGFAGSTKRLPAIAAMGFDVIYLPPIHPIGRSQPQGPQQRARSPAPSRSRSYAPWAIGAKDGGHDAIHPDLGTIEDFRRLRRARRTRSGLEVALDLALQAAPDHPWVDGAPGVVHDAAPTAAIAYAENPPEEVPGHLSRSTSTTDDPTRPVRRRCCGSCGYWIGHGVRIFRVDNPHTKPVAFWEWLHRRGQRGSDPDVIFLAEAFTRPADDARASARAGFQQSYTYFTWRNTKIELEDYFTEVSHESARRASGPNFFVEHPRHPHTSTCSTAARRRSGSGQPWPPPPARHLGRLRAATSSCEHVARGRAARNTSTTEKYQCGAATGTPRRNPARTPGAVHHPAERDPPRRTRRCSDLQNLTLHRSTDNDHGRASSMPRSSGRPDTLDRGGQPGPAPAPARHGRAGPRSPGPATPGIVRTTARSRWMTC